MEKSASKTMKGKRSITKGGFKPKPAKKLTDTILKPRFTGSQVGQPINNQRSKKFSVSASRAGITKKTINHKESSLKPSQTNQLPLEQERNKREEFLISTNISSSVSSFPKNADRANIALPSMHGNLVVNNSQSFNRFSGTSESDVFFSSGYSQTPTQSWTTSTTPQPAPQTEKSDKLELEGIIAAQPYTPTVLSQPRVQSSYPSISPASRAAGSRVDIDAFDLLEDCETKTTTINMCDDDDDDDDDDEEVILFSKKRRKRRSSLVSESSSHLIEDQNLAKNETKKEVEEQIVVEKSKKIKTVEEIKPKVDDVPIVPCPFTELNIPLNVIQQWKKRNISQLHSWQLECLKVNNGVVLKGGSLVYSAPTGGGKTLVAEVLMVRRILSSIHEGIVLWVVPLKALANEVASKLSMLLEHLAVVEVYHSDNSKSKISSKVKVAVCTIERANMIVNQQIEEQYGSHHSMNGTCGGGIAGDSIGISGISMIVVDEVHNIEKNAVLERLLTKINFMNGSQQSSLNDSIARQGNIQVVACSATIPNVGSISKWCNASFYSTSTRTTILDWFVVLKHHHSSSGGKDGSENSNKKIIPHFSSTFQFDITSISNPCSSSMALSTTPTFRLPAVCPNDTHGLITLCADAVSKSNSVLVFCNSRASTSKLALFVATALRKASSSSSSSSMPSWIETQFARDCLVSELHQVSGKQAAEGLASLLQVGIGFHHAALSQEEKSLVEKGFRDRTIDILFATTTLANGVNLPADRVIIYDPIKFSRGTGNGELYTIQELKQMGGRAAREGVGSGNKGDVIILTTTGANGGGVITEEQKLKGKRGFTLQDILGQPQPPILSPLLCSTTSSLSKLPITNAANAASQQQLSSCHPMVIASDVMECCVLEAVCLGIATTKPSLVAYTHSLFASYCLDDLKEKQEDTRYGAVTPGGGGGVSSSDSVIPLLVEALDEALVSLQGSGSGGDQSKQEDPLLTLVADNTYVPEALGRATINSFLTPKEARTLLQDIIRASRGMVVQSQLHLLCLVSPIESGILPDFSVLFDELVLGNHEDWCHVADVYICPTWRGRVQQYVKGTASKHLNRQQVQFDTQGVDAKIGRFFRALLLRHIIDEEPLSSGLPGLINLEVGKAQSLQRSAYDLCGKVLNFCKTLGFNSIAAMLKPLRNRLQFGIKKELLPLKALSSAATPSLIRLFYDAGFTTLKSFLQLEGPRRRKDLLLDILAKRRQVHYIQEEEQKGGGRIKKGTFGQLHGHKLSVIDSNLVQKIIDVAQHEVSKSKILKSKGSNF